MKPRNYPILTALLAILAGALHLYGQGTAFTYQGRLNDGGNPATGLYDLRFGLYDAASGGGQQGNLVTNSTTVSNGLFTTTLDFGNQFNGTDRWLEISLRTNSNGAFTTLSPRQAITATPYATSAKNAETATHLVGNGANLTALNATNLTSGTLPLTRLSGITDQQMTATTWLLATNLDGGNAGTLNGLTATNFWRSTGNAGTTPGIHFLGTTDNQELQFRVNNTIGLRLLATAGHPSLIGGDAINYAGLNCYNTFIGGGSSNSVVGETIYEGGYYSVIGGGNGNTIKKLSPAWYPDNAVIGGGRNNTNAGYAAVIPGGELNFALGAYALAAGYRAKATNEGTFVWADSTAADFNSTANNQFLIRASGGVGINTNNTLGNALSVSGNTYVNGNLRMDTSAGAYSEGFALNCPPDMGGYGGLLFHSASRGGTLSADTIKWDIAYNYAPEIATTGGGLAFIRNNTTTSMYLSTNGNVGIGTTSPQAALQVASPGGYFAPQVTITQLNPSDYARLQIGVTTFPSWSLTVPPAATPDLRFYNGAGDVARLTYSGAFYGQSFNPTSDRNAKENFRPVSPREVLAKVAALPISEWNFKTAPGELHLGPMAQDFYAAFGTGTDDKHIATVDADGVALAAIQGLNEKVNSEVTDLRSENAELKQQNDTLAQKLTALEKLVQTLVKNQ